MPITEVDLDAPPRAAVGQPAPAAPTGEAEALASAFTEWWPADDLCALIGLALEERPDEGTPYYIRATTALATLRATLAAQSAEIERWKGIAVEYADHYDKAHDQAVEARARLAQMEELVNRVVDTWEDDGPGTNQQFYHALVALAAARALAASAPPTDTEPRGQQQQHEG